MTETFWIDGSIGGVRRTIFWDGAFHDREVLDLIAFGVEDVSLTPTGPSYRPAARPIEVAIVTALAVFDKWGPDAVLQFDATAEAVLTVMHDDARPPEGAVS